jgi:predicted nuclease with TOPRIM domain
MTDKQLLELKQKVEQAKQTVSELKGERTALLNQLTSNFKCSNIEDAKKKIKNFEKQVIELNETMEQEIQLLEELL